MLAVLSAFLTLLALEGVARWLPLWPDQLSDLHPRLGLAHIPGARGYWVNLVAPLEYRTYVEISEQGLRDRVYPFAKPPATKRILVLGDSLAEGLEVPLDDTFAKRLERDLEFGGPGRIEVINASHYGYGTDQELIFFHETGKRWQPDVVLLAFTPGNDVENNLAPISIAPKPYFTLSADGDLEFHPLPSSTEGATDAQPASPGPSVGTGRLSSLRSWLYAHSKLYRFMTFQLRVRFPGAHDFLRRITSARQTAGLATRRTPADEAERLRTGLDLTMALLRRLHHDVAASGAELVVLVLPDPSQAGATPMGSGNPDADGWSFGSAAADAERRITGIAAEISGRCEQEGIPVVDVFASFEELSAAESLQPFFYRVDGHFTSEGHALTARIVRDALKKHLP
jgi:lysophospholipase L1-like esterase